MANPMVLIETTSGDILLELFADKAPKTVENFLVYIQDGSYVNTVFHRVIKNFMIQGGGMTLRLEPVETREPIENEATNGLSNEKGTIAMARTSEPHSASRQFFINTADNAFLDHKEPSYDGFGYCVFGKVVEGMDTVAKIEKGKTKFMSGHSDVPEDMVLITATSIFE